MGIEIIDVDNKQFWDSIRQSAQKFIKEKIQSDQILKENIFMGRHWFKEPYHAMYILRKGKLRENIISVFNYNWFWGRSKGKYTIEIK